MNDAPLHLRLRKSGTYRFSETGKTVHAEDINILSTTIFEVIHHRQLEFGTLILADPHAQNVLTTIHLDTQNNIRSFGDILVVFLDFVVNRVHEDKRIYAF